MVLETYQLPKERALFNLKDKINNNSELKENEKETNGYQLFYDICDEFKKYYVDAYESNSIQTLDDEADPTKVLHSATIGHPIAVRLIKGEIQKYLSVNGYESVEPPSYYKDLTDGIFEEQFGWGPLSVWKTMYHSPTAAVFGTDIYYETEKGRERAPFSFESIEKVRNLCERFKDLDRKNKLDEINNPVLETRTVDKERVSVGIPHTFIEPVITLRRNITQNYTIEEQSKLNTIPKEMVDFIKILAQLPLNSIIAGPPKSGKNTFLVSMISETIYDLNDIKFYVESSYEWSIRDLFPHAPVIHAVGKGEELDKNIFPASLRHDTTTLIVSEIRQNEAEIFGEAQERGFSRVIGTIHNSDPVNIPAILARINLHYHKLTIDYAFEYIRFAENLHFSITMEARSASEKRVTGIQFYEVDPMSLEVRIVRIMDYDWEHDEWTFNDYIPKNVQRILRKKHRNQLKQMQGILTSLKSKKPMSEERQFEVAMTGRV